MARGEEAEGGMSDYSRHDIADRLALWNAAQSDADTRALIEDLNDLRAELAATSLREREADRAVRELLALINGTPRGVAWALWQMITGRTS